jgi:hypothetical protein
MPEAMESSVRFFLPEKSGRFEKVTKSRSKPMMIVVLGDSVRTVLRIVKGLNYEPPAERARSD